MLITLPTAKCSQEDCKERSTKEFETKAYGMDLYVSSLLGRPREIVGSGPDPAAGLVPSWSVGSLGTKGPVLSRLCLQAARLRAAGLMSQGQCRCLKSPLGLQLETAPWSNKGKSWLRCFLSVQSNATGFYFHRERQLPPKKKKSIPRNIAVQRIVMIWCYIFSKGTNIVPKKTLIKCTVLFFKAFFRIVSYLLVSPYICLVG